ncbi:EAL domain-containing protein [Amphritea sp.]|uniref:EAL domain-containing protein n=1 Tax=Amphritea sp. TaxID=1872502 RepID=UPI003D1504A4
MSCKFIHRIAFKQARSVLFISLLLGLISTGWQIYNNHDVEQHDLQLTVGQIISLHKEAASRAVYNLNTELAEEITSTLISNPLIYHAAIIDDFGDNLAESSRVAAEQTWLASVAKNLLQIDRHIDEPLLITPPNQDNARLIIDLDTVHIANTYANRAMTSLSIGIISSLILASIFLLLIYRYLSLPILNIANWVNRLRQNDNCPPLPYDKPDELGELVAGFARLWEERKDKTDQLKETIEQLSKSEYFSRSLMDNAGDAMFLCLPDSTIVRVNHQAAESLKTDESSLTGQSLANFSKNYSAGALQALFVTIEEKQVSTVEDIQSSAQGDCFPVEARCIRMRLHDNDYILILARDISVRKEAEKQIFDLAFFDTLTGLANRRLFIDRLNSVMKLHQDSQRYGAVLHMDLDRFKTINDSLGHSVGDAILCEVAKRLTRILPEKSTCARFGGDEFVVLLPDSGSSVELCAEIAANCALQILAELQIPFNVDSHQLFCSTSIGIAVFPDKQSSATETLRHADTALYRVKALGRNSYQFFDPEMQSSAQERLELEKGLHLALENSEFELWYQPQVNSDDQILGAEALLRWRHPDKGIILPGSFISIAEESGQILEIGDWVLRQAINQLAAWRKQGLPESFKRLAINISPLQFMQIDFVDRLLNLLETAEVPGLLLELEITENMLLNNFETACSKMKLLKQRGISFAIDDFGTGYSSLKYLRYLPLDILKIDRSFVTGLRPSSELAAIVEVIIATADRLNLTVIAEGVETLNERSALMELGCNCFQGYLFSKPVNAEQFYDRLQQAHQSSLA